MSKVLVIHPDDRTTDMLKAVYEGKGYDVISDIYISDEAFEHCCSLRLIHHMPERCIIHVRPHGNQGPQTVKIVPMDLPKRKEDSPEDNDLPF